jgi:hypothetical protein
MHRRSLPSFKTHRWRDASQDEGRADANMIQNSESLS